MTSKEECNRCHHIREDCRCKQPTHPTAREKFEELKADFLEADKEGWGKDSVSKHEIYFLLALVEAAMDGWAKDYSKEYGRNLSETLDDKWQTIAQRLAEGEKS